MSLHSRDHSLLLQLQQHLSGIGKISVNKNLKMLSYSIRSKKDLIILMKHLDNYPLLTQKAADYI
jgi:hypothetical protein